MKDWLDDLGIESPFSENELNAQGSLGEDYSWVLRELKHICKADKEQLDLIAEAAFVHAKLFREQTEVLAPLIFLNNPEPGRDPKLQPLTCATTILSWFALAVKSGKLDPTKIELPLIHYPLEETKDE